jgi:tetratricopeptide (TPR) repeat protein
MECYLQKLAEFEQAIAQTPEDARAIAHRGEIYRLMARHQEALVDFNRAIELKPSYYWAIAHRGEVYYQIKQYQKALSDFDRVIKLSPNPWNIAHRGATYTRLKRYQEALSDLNLAIESKPDYAWALINRCQVYALEEDYELALVDFDHAIAIDKDIICHWQGERGLLLNYLGRYDETIQCCNVALQKYPDDYITLYSLAVALVRHNKETEARSIIAQAKRILESLMRLDNIDKLAGIIYRLAGLAALENQTEIAWRYLKAAIPLHYEPIELARRDPAWLNLHTDANFVLLISQDS